jgi:hypothetical protein
MGGACNTDGEKNKPAGKRLLGRPRRGSLYNIKMYLREMKGGGTVFVSRDRDS